MSTQPSLIEMSSAEVMSEKSKRLDDCKLRFKAGLREQCLALYQIQNEGLFRLVPGCETIADWAFAELGLAKSPTYRLLECAEFFMACQSPIGEYVANSVTHIEQIRGLSGMKPESKVRVVAAALKESERTGIPLTGQLMQKVAKERFNWKSRQEYRESQRSEAQKTAAEFSDFSDKAQRVMGALLQLGKPSELVERYGEVRAWGPHFDALVEWVEELKELA